MAAIPTVKVKADNAAGYVIVNKDDANPADIVETHTDGTVKVLYTEADAEAQAEVKPKKKVKK